MKKALSTSTLAQRLNLTPSRAGHLVVELFGVPFAQLVLLERLKRAKDLLRTTDERIGVIALKSGFGDECRFSRTFRRETGMTRGAYRRRNSVPPDFQGRGATGT
ncbi:MAG: AraC family transcriptional regulator [Spirochaetes bacterium]|nr:AraC family transcriptional regulator [Spirochaetota bacterium]